jgi:thymidylate kinase
MEALHIVDKLLVADKVKEAQRQGCIVVCSRWYESAKAYAEANGFEEEWHESLIYNLPHPDLTILLDIGDIDYKARLRCLGEDGLDKYETNQVMQVRVRESMREWASNSQTRLVDGSRTQDEVALAVWQIVEQKLLAMAAFVSHAAEADRELLRLVHQG